MKWKTENLRPGLIVAVRSYTFIGRTIRWGLRKWSERLHKKYWSDRPRTDPWANHTGIIVRSPSELVVGEALAQGSVMTPLESYIQEHEKKGTECRVYEVLDADRKDEAAAAQNWFMEIEGTSYDFACYPRLLIKSLFFDIWSKAAGWEWSNWCTEGVAKSWDDFHPPHIDRVFPTKNPTPLTVEQMAGEQPMKPSQSIRLRNVTDQMIEQGVV